MYPREQISCPSCLRAFVAGLSFSTGEKMSEGRGKRNGQTNPTARNEMVDTRLAWVLPRPAYGLGARRAAMPAFAGSAVVG